MKTNNVLIYDRDGIPPQVTNFAATMLGATSPVTAKENAKLTLMTIRKYCDDMLIEYDKHSFMKKRA
jgi:hypothetical protein